MILLVRFVITCDRDVIRDALVRRPKAFRRPDSIENTARALGMLAALRCTLLRWDIPHRDIDDCMSRFSQGIIYCGRKGLGTRTAINSSCFLTCQPRCLSWDNIGKIQPMISDMLAVTYTKSTFVQASGSQWLERLKGMAAADDTITSGIHRDRTMRLALNNHCV